MACHPYRHAPDRRVPAGATVPPVATPINRSGAYQQQQDVLVLQPTPHEQLVEAPGDTRMSTVPEQVLPT